MEEELSPRKTKQAARAYANYLKTRQDPEKWAKALAAKAAYKKRQREKAKLWKQTPREELIYQIVNSVWGKDPEVKKAQEEAQRKWDEGLARIRAMPIIRK